LNISGFIAKRIAFNQQRSFSRFVIRLSVSATIISVMIMIVTIAFAEGFQTTISDKVFSFWGHIRIHNYEAARIAIAEETPIQQNDSVSGLMAKIPEIKTIQAYATKNAILKTSENMKVCCSKVWRRIIILKTSTVSWYAENGSHFQIQHTAKKSIFQNRWPVI
jgi:lipoprotein-releasing system permease protein